MSSRRLPAKALLDVQGAPAAVLCARRAGNSGLPIVVAISDHPSDDALAEILQQHSVAYSRGSLDDVLDRFCNAARYFDDDTVICRLTADNLFPDGEFLEECLQAFRSTSAEYATTIIPQGNQLPYGLVAEFFRAGLLREAWRKAVSPSEREHVTPYMRAGQFQIEYLAMDPGDNYSDYRCTMDTLEDYLRILRVFKNQDAENVHWKKLCRLLRALESESKCKLPHVVKHGRTISRMALGTVQLGQAYGVTNRHGQPDNAEADAILATAIDEGITVFDTAAAYGSSEQRIGSFFGARAHTEVALSTKLSPFENLSPNAEPESVKILVEHSVFRSCAHLGRRKLDYFLMHRWDHYRSHRGVIWQTLLDLKNEDYIDRLGASVSNPDQALEALQVPQISFIQIPFNFADWRWKQAGFDVERAKRPDVLVQARSIYLQGLLVSEPDPHPVVTRFEPHWLLERTDHFVQKFSRTSRQDLCCAYVRGQAWIDSLVIGCETPAQVVDNAAQFHKPLLNLHQSTELESALADVPEALLDPARWNHEPKQPVLT